LRNLAAQQQLGAAGRIGKLGSFLIIDEVNANSSNFCVKIGSNPPLAREFRIVMA